MCYFPNVVLSETEFYFFYDVRHRIGPDGTLVIRNMDEKDGGVYRCLASNLAGTDARNSILTYIGEFHTHIKGVHL